MDIPHHRLMGLRYLSTDPFVVSDRLGRIKVVEQEIIDASFQHDALDATADR